MEKIRVWSEKPYDATVYIEGRHKKAYIKEKDEYYAVYVGKPSGRAAKRPKTLERAIEEAKDLLQNGGKKK
jgi:predicted RNase H-like HicB family nuclease